MPSMAGWTSAEGSQFQLGQQAVCSRLFTHTTLCHGASHHRFKFNNLRHWKALLLFHWTNVGDYPSALAPCWGLLLISSPSHQEGIWCLSPQLLIGHQIHRCAPSLDCVNLNRDVLVMIQIYSFFFFCKTPKGRRCTRWRCGSLVCPLRSVTASQRALETTFCVWRQTDGQGGIFQRPRPHRCSLQSAGE